jgi:integrase
VPLTDLQIKGAKPGPTVRKLSDGHGLQLWVMPNGSRLWRLAYRFNGQQKKLSIGPYGQSPAIGIAAAREAARQARERLKSGIDPHEQKKHDRRLKATADGQTLSIIVDELLGKKSREGVAASTIKKLRSYLRNIPQSLADRPIASVTSREVLHVLKEVEGRGRYHTAGALKTLLSESFRLAMATDRCETDPTVSLRGALTAVPAKNYPAIIDPVQFGQLLRAIDTYPNQTVRAGLQLLALLFPRPTELRAAEWDEFNFDTGIWSISGHRTKTRKPHEVPLPMQAIEILKELRSNNPASRFLLPSSTHRDRCISEATLNSALKRLDYPPDVHVPHGFRSSASTLLNGSQEFSPDIIERALAHGDPDRIRAIYHRGAYWDERKRLANWWADYLDQLRSGAKVIPLRA